MKHDRHFIHPNASISCFLIMSDNELSLQVKTSYTIKFKIVMKKISSLLVVLLLMLASFTAGVEYERGDTNHDGVVNIADVTCLIDYLLNGTWPDDPVTPPDDHEWVDLGLPSGSLWATCNVGANSPEEYGDYFAWGETESKEVYNWETYKWCNGDWDTMTKYCTKAISATTASQMVKRSWILRTMLPTSTGAPHGASRPRNRFRSWMRTVPGFGLLRMA